jgi:hypothetical protein
MDLYSYCNGDPVNGYDPDGRFGKSVENGNTDAWANGSGVFGQNTYANYASSPNGLGYAIGSTVGQITGTANAVVAGAGSLINYGVNTAADVVGVDPNAAQAALLAIPVLGEVKIAGEIAEATEGGISYGALDSLGRPTGISATITEDMIGTGTPANSSIIPPGWSGNGVLYNEARGHLLGAQLGGSGDVAENLVTLQQNPVNSPVMRGFENQVRTVVEGGQSVNYSVTPIYNGNNLVPRGITIFGTGSDGFNLGVSVLNPIGR